MITGYMYIFGFFSIHLGVICFTYFLSRYKGSLMVNMMMTMALAMVFGLSFGFFIGIVLHGHLLYSTLFSIILAGITGYILGVNIAFDLYQSCNLLYHSLRSFVPPFAESCTNLLYTK